MAPCACVRVCVCVCVRACVLACEQELGLCSQVGSCSQAGRLAAKIQGLGVKQTNKRRAQLKDGGAYSRGRDGPDGLDGPDGGRGGWEDPLYWETFCRRLQEPLETENVQKKPHGVWGRQR